MKAPILTNIFDSTIRGVAAAYNMTDIPIILWNPQARAAFDVFDEVKPEIFITDIQNLTRSVAKCIRERGDIKVFIRNHGAVNDAFLDLKFNNCITDTFDNSPRADLISYCGHPPKKEMETDVLILTDFLTVEEIEDNLRHITDNKIRCKIFGSRYVRHHAYLGMLTIEEMASAIRSAKRVVVPTQNDDMMNVMAAGGFVVQSLTDSPKRIPIKDMINEGATCIHLAEEFLRKSGEDLIADKVANLHIKIGADK